MDLKRLSAAALALTLAAGLTAPALAAGEDLLTAPASNRILIAPNPNAVPERYQGVVNLNGGEIQSVTYSIPVEGSWETVDNVIPTGELPGAPAGYVPMRLLCQAVQGAAYWYEEERRSSFYLNGARIDTDFSDNSVYVESPEGELILQEGVSCYLRRGVTFLPAGFLSTLDGVSVDVREEGDREIFDVSVEVPGTPLYKLALAICDEVGIGGGAEPEEYFSIMGIDASAFEELTGQVPLINIRSDAVILGRYAQGADKESGKAALRQFQDIQIQNFEHYLQKPLEVAKNGRIVESDDGNYVMLILSEDNDKAEELFREGIARLESGD